MKVLDRGKIQAGTLSKVDFVKKLPFVFLAIFYSGKQKRLIIDLVSFNGLERVHHGLSTKHFLLFNIIIFFCSNLTFFGYKVHDICWDLL